MKIVLNDGRTIKETIKDGFYKFKGFVIRNKNYILILTPVVITGVTTIMKIVGKQHNLHTQKEIKENYCYDRSLGHYWKLRRELTNNEWLEIDRRKKNGERLSDVLDEMKVLY